MELKVIFDAVIAYCVNEPFHATIVIGLLVFLLALIVAIVILTVFEKKQVGNQQIEQTQIAKNKAPILKQPNLTSSYFDEPPTLADDYEETTSLEEEEVEEEEEQEEQDDKSVPTPAIITQTRAMKKWEKPKNTSKNYQNKQTNKHKEGTMLHDELKDINTEFDFYEEDANDTAARYRGKWEICRVVTNDNQTDDLYFFELHASNGDILLSSEEYANYNGALRGIETHKSNILRNNFRISLSKNGDYTFKLLNGKGLLLCFGDHYPTKTACENVIELVKRFARTAFVDENIEDIVVKVPEEVNNYPLPMPESYNGKWVIDSHLDSDGERVYFFELLANEDECLLSSEEYSTYVGAINGIQTYKTNMKNNNFRILLTKQGDYIFKLLNGNGQLLYLGEHYKTKRLCEHAVELIKRFAEHAPALIDSEIPKE